MKKSSHRRGWRQRPGWRHFRAWLVDTKTRVVANEKAGCVRVIFPVLRGWLLHHPKYGVEANWSKRHQLVRFLVLTKDVEVELALADPEVMMQHLIGFGWTRRKIEEWLDAIWGPRGPLAIPREDYLKIADFAEWWEAQRSKRKR